MKVPWKYRKVSANTYDELDAYYKRIAYSDTSNGSRFYCDSVGESFYRKGVKFLKQFAFVKFPRHWTRGIYCGVLKPGIDIVDCLVGVRNGRGNISWLVGQHYAGMCPFKSKWRRKLQLRKIVGRLGREG